MEAEAAVAAAKSKLSSNAESKVNWENCEGAPLLLGTFPSASSKAATSAGAVDTDEVSPFLIGVSI